MTVWLNPNYTKPKSCAHKVDGTEAQNQAINAIAEEFDVRKEQLEAIVKQFQEEIRKGLRNDGATGKLSTQSYIKTLGLLTTLLSSCHDPQFRVRPSHRRGNRTLLGT